MWKTRQGISTMTLYNNKKRDVAQLGSAFVLGTKCHGFKSCHPYLLLLLWAVTRDQLRSIQIGHNLQLNETICMRVQKSSFLFFTAVSPVVRKRSQFSSVERGSPKPDVVGSNPTERDSVLVIPKKKHSLQPKFYLLQIKEEVKKEKHFFWPESKV